MKITEDTKDISNIPPYDMFMYFVILCGRSNAAHEFYWAYRILWAHIPCSGRCFSLSIDFDAALDKLSKGNSVDRIMIVRIFSDKASFSNLVFVFFVFCNYID